MEDTSETIGVADIASFIGLARAEAHLTRHSKPVFQLRRMPHSKVPSKKRGNILSTKGDATLSCLILEARLFRSLADRFKRGRNAHPVSSIYRASPIGKKASTPKERHQSIVCSGCSIPLLPYPTPLPQRQRNAFRTNLRADDASFNLQGRHQAGPIMPTRSRPSRVRSRRSEKPKAAKNEDSRPRFPKRCCFPSFPSQRR